MSLTARPKTTPSARKRQGGHHRHNKSYLKTYWPYIPIATIVICGVLINNFLGRQESVLGWQTSFSDNTLLNLTNTDRAKAGESDLTLNSNLAAAAQAKASDMAAANYWSHTSPSGKTAEDFITSSGYQFMAAGENLAYGFDSAKSVMAAWMTSPEHKANILDSSYTNVGFGVAEAPNYLSHGPKVIVVAEYGEPSGSAATGIVNQPAMQNVSRLDSVTKTNASWSEIALTAIITASVLIIIIKHGLGLKKLLLESEDYIIKHPFLDMAIVLVATFAAVLSHSNGLIG